MTEKETFDHWAIVNLFGHTRVAGHVTEQTVGGETFVRVDIPHGDGFFTKLFGKGAIFSLEIVDEELARGAATQIDSAPVSAYDLQDFAKDAIAKARPRIEREVQMRLAAHTDPHDDDEVEF